MFARALSSVGDKNDPLPLTHYLSTGLGAKLGEGREAEIFAWGERSILRLMRDPSGADRLEQEALAAAAAAGAGAAPAVGELVTLEGRPGIVMDRVDGPDQLALLADRPWSVLAEAKSLGRLHLRIHRVAAPGGLPALGDQARERIRDSERLPAHLAEFALRILDELPGGDRLCHGDLYPGNVLVGPDGPVAVDWVNATRGDPHADVARTRLLLRGGTPPPGASTVGRRLDRIGRPLITRGYLRAYRRAQRLDDELLGQWEIVRAAERFWEDIVEEDAALTALLEARRAALGV